MPDFSVVITEAATANDLPAAARELFGQDAFSTLAWFQSTTQAALPADTQPVFQLASHGRRPLAVLPMQRRHGRLAALTTPYTCLWQPLLAPGLDAAALASIGRALAPSWRRAGPVRVDAIQGDAAWLPGLLAGLRGGGLRPLEFSHFGNWHTRTADLTWAAYLAGRDGALRSTIRRATRRLMEANGATFTLVKDATGLEAAIAAYATVYATSWKPPEPFPDFAAALIRASGAAGALRLGLITLRGVPIAAQIWLLHAGWAGVQKLAHDQAHHALAPGTVLTALMIRNLLDVDRVTEIDFGRGDDPYKQLWTDARRQLVGIQLADPWRPSGLAAMARHAMGKARRRLQGNGAALPPTPPM